MIMGKINGNNQHTDDEEQQHLRSCPVALPSLLNITSCHPGRAFLEAFARVILPRKDAAWSPMANAPEISQIIGESQKPAERNVSVTSKRVIYRPCQFDDDKVTNNGRWQDQITIPPVDRLKISSAISWKLALCHKKQRPNIVVKNNQPTLVEEPTLLHLNRNTLRCAHLA